MERRTRARRLTERRLDRGLGSTALHRLRQIASRAATLRMPVYLVGGVVRDLLLRRPAGDVDLVVEGDALALARALGQDGARLSSIHETFGTASVRFPDLARIDLGTARREHYRRAAALPEVEPASLSVDLLRRDFTINSIAMALDADRLGTLSDPGGGLADLAARRIRVLHEQSFRDDPTRAFRALRFAVRLRFSVEPATARLLREAAASGVFARLSGARLGREVRLLFEEARWDVTARALERYGLWRVVDSSLRPTRTDIERLGDLERWTRRGFRGDARVRTWVVALTWLARRLDPSVRSRLVARLAADRAAARELRRAPDEAERIVAALRGDGALRPGAVHRVCALSTPVAWLVALARTRPGRMRHALERWVERDCRIRLDIGGQDLLRCGITPGPRVSRGLAAALEARLDGQAPDRARQLAIALAVARRA